MRTGKTFESNNVIDNRVIKEPEEYVLLAEVEKQALIIVLDKKYYNGESFDTDIGNVKLFDNDSSGILEIVKDLRSRGHDAKILDIFINDRQLTIQADLTNDYIKLKLI